MSQEEDDAIGHDADLGPADHRALTPLSHDNPPLSETEIGHATVPIDPRPDVTGQEGVMRRFDDMNAMFGKVFDQNEKM